MLLQAVRRAAEQRAASTSARPSPTTEPARPKPAARKPLVQVRQKRGAAAVGDGDAIKRHRPEEEEAPPDAGDPAALAGLIGGYASDSEGEE